jgi:hypothetical protein
MCNWSTCNKRYHMSIFTAYNRLALVRFCILILLKAELWWVMFWYLLLYFSKIIVVEKCLKMYQIVYVYIHVSHGNSTDFVDKGLYLYVLCTNIHLQWGLWLGHAQRLPKTSMLMSMFINIQVYVPQNTTVPQNTSLIYFLYKIWSKYAINFIFVIIY